MAKITIEQLKENSEHWEWFPLEFILGDGYAMQFMFMGYDEKQGLFHYKHGFSKKYLVLSIDNVENDTYTVVKAWMEGKELFIWDEVKEEHKDDTNLYEAPIWMALQDIFMNAENTYGEHPGVPFNDEVRSKINAQLEEQGYNIKTITPDDLEKIDSGELNLDDVLGISDNEEDYVCPDCGGDCSAEEIDEVDNKDVDSSGKVGGRYLN
jgi:hypothetical protein